MCYEAFSVPVYGRVGEDLEAKARQEAFIRCGSNSLVMLSRDNSEIVHPDSTTFLQATFTFMEIPPPHVLAS